MALRRGLKCGRNHDLTCSVDLSVPSERTKFLQWLRQEKPFCVVMGPPCTAFGPWSYLNEWRAPLSWARAVAVGLPLAELACQAAEFQSQHGLHWLIENPWSSRMWQLPCFIRLQQRVTTFEVKCDQCQVGLKDPAGVPTLKPIQFMSSSMTLIKRLNLQCTHDHERAQIAGSVQGMARSKFAQTWPRQLCERIVSGIQELLGHQHKSEREQAFPAAEAPVVQDCPGCRAHAYKGDPRHTRRGAYRFPKFAV